MWRDKSYFIFGKYPSIVFEDLFDGFVYIAPRTKMQECSWTDNYISKEMFMRYKPFYEAKFKQKFSNADDVNAYFKAQYP